MVLIFITYIMLLGCAVGWVRIFYVCFKKIRLGVGKSKSRSLDANKKTEGRMYSNAGGELRKLERKTLSSPRINRELAEILKAILSVK